MSVLPLGIIFAAATATGFAQPPIPGDACRYDRTRASLRQLRGPASFSLGENLNQDRVSLGFHVELGTLLSVSREERGWSCVTGTVYVSGKAEPRSWWLESSRLQRIK